MFTSVDYNEQKKKLNKTDDIPVATYTVSVSTRNKENNVTVIMQCLKNEQECLIGFKTTRRSRVVFLTR